METITAHVVCGGNRDQIRPLAVCARKPKRGHSTLMKIERQAFAVGAAFVLYRGGRTCKVLIASIDRDRLELVCGRMTKRPEAYAIARVPVVESW